MQGSFVRERADVLFSKLLSLMISGKEFHVEAPPYMKLFLMLLERDLGKRNVFELSRRLRCNDSFLKLNNFYGDGGPI